MAPSVIDVYPPLNPSLLGRRKRTRLPFPLDDSRCRIYMQARQGLWSGLRGLGIRPGDEILVPAYHHGSEVEVLVRAGVRCRFYDSSASFEPDESELEALRTEGVRALYLIHPIGFAQASSRWRRWCDERGLRLLEDGAQSWLSTENGESVGAHADLALFCLYKVFGLPDGGAVMSRRFSGRPPHVRTLGLRGFAAQLARWASQRSSRAAALVGRISTDSGRYELPEVDFALSATDEQAARMTRLLLQRVIDLRAPERRRANFAYLAEALSDLRSPMFATLPSGSSPLVFPIEVEDKPAVVERLRRSGIRSTELWTVPHPALGSGDYPAAELLRAHLVGLPVHQELSHEDLAGIADAARAAVAGSSYRRPRALAGTR